MFLLVPGYIPAHPGCPGQNDPESRKTVVVVVVVGLLVVDLKAMQRV